MHLNAVLIPYHSIKIQSPALISKIQRGGKTGNDRKAPNTMTVIFT